jgi:hypothetical protein
MTSNAAVTLHRSAIISISLLVGDDGRAKFIEAVKRFAEIDDFAIRVVQLRHDGQHYMIELRSSDVNVTIANPFDDARELSVFFYESEMGPPSPAVVDKLVTDLESDIKDIPDTTIMSIKKK